MSVTGSNIGDYRVSYGNGLPNYGASIYFASGGGGLMTDEQAWEIAELLKGCDFITGQLPGGTIEISGLVGVVTVVDVPEPTP